MNIQRLFTPPSLAGGPAMAGLRFPWPPTDEGRKFAVVAGFEISGGPSAGFMPSAGPGATASEGDSGSKVASVSRCYPWFFAPASIGLSGRNFDSVMAPSGLASGACDGVDTIRHFRRIDDGSTFSAVRQCG